MSDSTSQQNRGLRLYDLLASAFLQENVDTCFALLGDANMYWASRLAERGCRVTVTGPWPAYSFVSPTVR